MQIKLNNSLIKEVQKKIKFWTKKMIFTDDFGHYSREDIQQEVLIQILNVDLNVFDEEKASFNTFITTIIKNKIRSMMTTYSYYKHQEINSLDQPVKDNDENKDMAHTDLLEDYSSENQYIKFEANHDLKNFLKKLWKSNKHSATVLTYIIDERLDVKEIADRLNCSVQYVYQILNKINKEYKGELLWNGMK